MGEVYFAHYRNEAGFMVLQDKEVVIKPEDLIAAFANNDIVDSSVLAGTGWEAYPTLQEYFANCVNRPWGITWKLLVTFLSLCG